MDLIQETKKLSRRDLLKTSAVASTSAFAAVLGAPAIINSQALQNPVVYGFIGAGRQGNFHLKKLSVNRMGRCVVVCDIYPPNLEQGVQTIGSNPDKEPADYRRVLDRKDVEAVFIVTPYHLHVPMVLDALSAGKHVFVEKVMAKEEEQIPKVYEAVQARPNQVFQVGLQRRYSAIYNVAMQMVQKGLLGKVQFIRAQWHRNGSWRNPIKDPAFNRILNWRLYREYSGGLMAELGSHQVDVANWAFRSEPVSVVGVGGLDYWKDDRDIFDNVSVIFEYSRGRKFVFTSICNNAHLDFSESIIGDEGSIEITLGLNSASAIFYPEQKAPDAPTSLARTADDQEPKKWAGATLKKWGGKLGFPIEPVVSTQNPGFIEKEIMYAKKWLTGMGVLEVEKDRDAIAVEEEHFFQCIREGKQPIANVAIGAADSRAVIYANRAMDLKQKVFWPGKT
jgi:predicted dehydrogenase